MSKPVKARHIRAMNRRKFIKSAAFATTASPLLSGLARAQDSAPAKLKGNINHSVCRWCYSKIKLEDLCAAVQDMGLTAIDLLQASDFATIKKYGLVCSMVQGPTVDGIGG